MKTSFIKKHPGIIVLQSLLDGVPVEIDGEEYWMDAETRQVAIRREAVNTKTGKTREIFIGIDMSVGAFVRMCERKLSEEQLIEIVGNNVLNKIRRKDRQLGKVK